VRDVGAYDDVVGYVRDVGPPLREYLDRLDPSAIGVSWSRSDEGADNLSHGMYLMLLECLNGAPYADRLAPAEGIAMALRARKLQDEIERIRKAIGVTHQLFEEIESRLRPDLTEVEL